MNLKGVAREVRLDTAPLVERGDRKNNRDGGIRLGELLEKGSIYVFFLSKRDMGPEKGFL